MKKMYFVLVLLAALLFTACENNTKVDYDLSETPSTTAYDNIRNSNKLYVTKNAQGKIKVKFSFPEIEYYMPIPSDLNYIMLKVNGADYSRLFNLRSYTFDLPIDYEEGKTIHISFQSQGKYNNQGFTNNFDGNIKLAYLNSNSSFTPPILNENHIMSNALLRWNMQHNNNMQITQILGYEKEIDGGGTNRFHLNNLDPNLRDILFPSFSLPDHFGRYGFVLNYYVCSFNAYTFNNFYVCSKDEIFYSYISEDSSFTANHKNPVKTIAF